MLIPQTVVLISFIGWIGMTATEEDDLRPSLVVDSQVIFRGEVVRRIETKIVGNGKSSEIQLYISTEILYKGSPDTTIISLDDNRAAVFREFDVNAVVVQDHWYEGQRQPRYEIGDRRIWFLRQSSGDHLAIHGAVDLDRHDQLLKLLRKPDGQESSH